MADEERKGGLGKLDPAVVAFQKKGAANPAAQTKKQKKDAKRVRVKLDVPEELKRRLTEAAAAEETSLSQLAGFLLDRAMGQYETDEALRDAIFEAKVPSRSMKIRWNLEF